MAPIPVHGHPYSDLPAVAVGHPLDAALYGRHRPVSPTGGPIVNRWVCIGITALLSSAVFVLVQMVKAVFENQP